MDQTASVHQILCKSRKKKCDVDYGTDYTSVQERNHELYTGVRMASSYSPRPEKGETGEEQSQEHAHYFL
jgi:hypothetical protein